MNGRAVAAPAVFLVAATLITGALVHFVLILAMPLVAERDAYSRLALMGPVGATIALPPPGPGERGFRYEDPAIASAFCRFDLTNGPVRVTEPLGRAGFASLSFHSRRGAVFYALTDRAATHGRMEAVIVTAAQLRALVAQDDEDDPSEDLRVVSPTLEGFVLTRAFGETPSLYAKAAEQAKSLVCAPDAPAK